jgi:hypothetical protein
MHQSDVLVIMNIGIPADWISWENHPVAVLRTTARVLLGLAFAFEAAAEMPDPATLSNPPSVAIDPRPKPRVEPVRVLVDTIPAKARFVTVARASLGAKIRRGMESAIGKALSESIDQLIEQARQAGANTIVLLSTGHGRAVPISHSDVPLVLDPDHPSLAAILFDCDATLQLTEAEKHVQFVIDVLPRGRQAIRYHIDLQLNTAKAPLDYWFYGNISRFVKDAVDHHLDTISLQSSADNATEEVWLPGNARPLRISKTTPVIGVTIFKREKGGTPTGR